MSKESQKWLSLTIKMVFYSSLILLTPIIADWKWRGFNLQEILHNAFGYIFAIILGHFPVKMLRDKMWEPIKATDEKRADKSNNNNYERWVYRPQYGQVMGFVERALYLVCLQIGARELIPLWIGAKIAGGWSGWNDKLQGRDLFNVVLLGNIFSLAYAFYGYQLINWSYEDGYKFTAVFLTGFFVSGCWVIWFYLDCKQKDEMALHKKIETIPDLINELRKKEKSI